MKKTISLFIAIMIIVMTAVPVAAFSENQSYGSVGKTAQEPTIDGVRDAMYDYATALPVDRVLGGELAAQGTAYLLYSADNLFILVEVSDSTDIYIDGADVWNADCVEVLFDWDDSGTVQQYRLNSANELTGDKTEERDWSAKVVKNDSGYTAEFGFALDSADAGTQIGMMIMITDLHTEGDVAQNNIMLANSAATGGPWDFATYDYLVLGDDIVLPEPETEAEAPSDPVPAAPQTLDIAIIISAVTLAISAIAIFALSKKRHGL